MAAGSFKVIIVGGGPVGLTAAHALRLANIDFVILERQSQIVVDAGAALALSAGNLRVMHQLGLLEKIMSIGSEARHKKVFTLDGTLIKDGPFFHHMKMNHGTAYVIFHRAQFIKILYEGLPEVHRAKILTGKNIVDIVTDDNGVKVSCADRSSYEGSIVLGADGAHSKTRSLMRKMALESDAGSDWNLEEPYLTTYKCLWFSIPWSSEQGVFFETYHKHFSTMCISGRDRAWLMVYQKLPEPTRERMSYTEADMDACAEAFAKFPVTETIKFKDAYCQRMDSGMAFLEEGLANHWSWGRIVLAGDSCHKFTPNAGLGFQNGVQDVVDLCNRLHTAINTAPGGLPSTATLAGLFQSYQTYRSNALQAEASMSAFLVRAQAWATPLHYVISRYIMTWSLADYLLFSHFASFVKKALVLDYVAAEEPFEGRVPWEHKMKSRIEHR